MVTLPSPFPCVITSTLSWGTSDRCGKTFALLEASKARLAIEFRETVAMTFLLCEERR